MDQAGGCGFLPQLYTEDTRPVSPWGFLCHSGQMTNCGAYLTNQSTCWPPGSHSTCGCSHSALSPTPTLNLSSTRPWLPFPLASCSYKKTAILVVHSLGSFCPLGSLPPSLSLSPVSLMSYVFLSSPLFLCPKLHLLSWSSFVWTLPLTSTIKTSPSTIPRRRYVPVLILSPWTEPPSYSSLLWSR